MEPWTSGPINALHRETLEFCFVYSGSGTGDLGGQQTVQSTEAYILIPPNTLHSSWTESNALEELVIHLRADALAELAAEQGLMELLWRSGQFKVTAEIKRALDHLRSGEGTPGEALAQVLLKEHQGVLHAARAAAVDPRLARLAAHIRRDPSQALDLNRMADIAQMSRSHLVRSFKETLGLTPMNFLKRARLELACEQMLRTKQSLTTIAHATGFSSSGRFSEAFRSAFGESPATWRRRSISPVSPTAGSAARSRSPIDPPAGIESD